MVPLSRRDSAPRALGASDPVYALLARVRATDTPYRAWAATALAHAGDTRHRPVGAEMVRSLRGALPTRPADWEHGDVACFAILAADALTLEERRQVAEAVPPPNDDPVRRSRFYASPLYVYLAARGLTGELPDAARLATFVAKDAAETAARPGTDLPSLVLQLATSLELEPVRAVDAALLRSMHARLVTSAGEPEGAIAVRWLLERYGARWPTGTEATGLREAAERYAAAFDPTAVAPDGLRPDVAVMRIETLVGRQTDYRMITSDHVRREVIAGVRRRHWVAAGSYVITLGALCGVPAWFLAAKAGAPLGLTLGVALMTWGPSSLWATLAEFGRLRRDGALAGATLLAALYYVYLAYVTLTHGTLDITGKDAVLAIVPVLVSTMIGAAPATREQ